MFPEKVVGSTNLQTGESIPPDFAKQIILEQATAEERKLVEENIQNIYQVADEVYERTKTSDKKVVILLDELLNVKPAVQSLVYTLVLNRFVEMGKGLKLPDNVVIVATGNQKKYSMVAEDLAEPLEKRIKKIDELQTLDELNAKTYSADDTRRYVKDGITGYETIDLAYTEHQREINNEGRGI